MRSEPTISIRVLWPFARVIAGSNTIVEGAERATATFADPDGRIPRREAMRIAAEAVARTGNPSLGLRAAERIDAGDFDVLEYAARSMPTLGAALEVVSRYHRLLDDSAEVVVETHGGVAKIEYRTEDSPTQPPCINDFIIGAALNFSERNTTGYTPPLEVHLVHARPSYADEYDRVFRAPVKFRAPCNAVIFDKARLSAPMLRPNRTLAAAFDSRASQLMSDLRKSQGVSGRVREELTREIRTGAVGMRETSRRLAMSTATLRRRLQEENATFSGILDEARHDLALRYLGEPQFTVTEIAFLLGFRSVAAFGRAFKRWTGYSPVAYRERPAPS